MPKQYTSGKIIVIARQAAPAKQNFYILYRLIDFIQHVFVLIKFCIYYTSTPTMRFTVYKYKNNGIEIKTKAKNDLLQTNKMIDER
jgi:hypothetical protein